LTKFYGNILSLSKNIAKSFSGGYYFGYVIAIMCIEQCLIERCWRKKNNNQGTSTTISENNKTDKKLISRWDSEREPFTTTSYTHYSPQ